MTQRLPLFLLGAALALLLLVEWFAPRPLDWRPSFEDDATQPYGSRVLYELLPDLLGGAEVERVDRPPYLHLGDSTDAAATYFFLTDAFAPDDGETRRLYRYAERGNTVFIAATSFEGPLADTLGIATGSRLLAVGTVVRDSALSLTNPRLQRPGGFSFNERLTSGYFTDVDTARTVVLGRARGQTPNYVRVDVGEGAFYLSAVPLAFTNYGLLGGDGAAYAAAAFAYLPAQPTFWDAYAKPRRTAGSTPLRFVLADPALRWAYFVALIGVVLFILFRGRRWQRAVPVVAPPPNRAREFVETVGRLYHQHGDDRDLVEKKARYFLDRLRGALNETALDFSDASRDRVARKAGVARADVDGLFDLFLRLRSASRIPAADLLDLDRRTDAFFCRLA
jgi:hypothetical protein